VSETEPQLDAQVLHRVRDSLISQQTSQIRGILLERCIVVPHGRHKLLDILVALLLEQDHMIFFSINLRSPVYEFWEWPSEIRWGRIFRRIS
jgi:hypothetical protein